MLLQLAACAAVALACTAAAAVCQQPCTPALWRRFSFVARRGVRTPGLLASRLSYTFESAQNFWISGSRTTALARRLKAVAGSWTVAE
jgi:hypothetical protein